MTLSFGTPQTFGQTLGRTLTRTLASTTLAALLSFAAMAPHQVHAEDLNAAAAEEAKNSKAKGPLRDPLFFLDGSADAWSVTKSNLGCFVVSPRGSGGIRIALGRHAKFGIGLLLIGMPLSMSPDSPGEPVVIAAGGRKLNGAGHIVGRDIVFIPLSADDLGVSLRELWYANTLWITITQTAMSQGGLKAKEAVEEYGRVCGGPAPKSPAS
jgi:hypothetical protein